MKKVRRVEGRLRESESLAKNETLTRHKSEEGRRGHGVVECLGSVSRRRQEEEDIEVGL